MTRNCPAGVADIMADSPTPETDRHTGLRHDIHALCETSRRLERERNALLERFTNLDEPKYSGEPMLDSVLATENEDFRAWVASLPPTYWARYDLSAARIGWEAACKFLENVEVTNGAS